MITRSMLISLDELRQLVGRSEQPKIVEDRCAPLLGSSVGEADEPDAVLGMLLKLAGDQLADITGTDDDGVLPEQRDAVSPGPRAIARPARTNAIAITQNATMRTGVGWITWVKETTMREQPDADRDDGEDADDVVDGRVVGALAVSAVETRSAERSRPRAGA